MTHRQRNQLLIAGIAIAAACVTATQPRAAEKKSTHHQDDQLPHPIVDTHHLMELFNQPVYMYLREAMQDEPSDDEGWSTLKDRGLQAAEVMNLVALRDGKETEHANWDKHVRTAQQAGLKLNEAAKAKNWENTQQAYQLLVKNCNDCHQDVAPDHAPQVMP